MLKLKLKCYSEGMERIDIQKIFTEITGLSHEIKNLKQITTTKGLPLIITNSYEIKKAEILNSNFNFIILRKIHDTVEIRRIVAHNQIIEKALNEKNIFVLSDLKTHQRKSLIANKINFIDLTGSIHLPDLLLVLKKTKSENKEEFSGLSQWAIVALIRQMIVRDLEGKTISQIAEIFKISIMHASRFTEELVGLDLVSIEREGSRKHLHFPLNRELWGKANSFLKSPVFKKIYTDSDIKFRKSPFAGLTALGELTMLDGGEVTTYAIGKKQLKEFDEIKVVPKEEANFCIEVWNWDPQKIFSRNIVDEISLYLSLKDDNDDRTQIALHEILEKILGDK